MKKSSLSRSSFLSRKTRMKRTNPEKLKKRRSRKPRLKASVRREALTEAGHQCTYQMRLPSWVGLIRCQETENLQVHETKYPATVDDCVVLCRWHHALVESRLRPWNRGRLGR